MQKPEHSEHATSKDELKSLKLILRKHKFDSKVLDDLLFYFNYLQGNPDEQTQYKRLLPLLKGYTNGVLDKIRQRWVTGKMNLDKASEVMDLIWKISAFDKHLGKPFYSKCNKMLLIIDKWINQYASKHPDKTKALIIKSINYMKQKEESLSSIVPSRFINILMSHAKENMKTPLLKVEVEVIKTFFKSKEWGFLFYGALDSIVITNKANPDMWKVFTLTDFIQLAKKGKLNDKLLKAISTKYEKTKKQQEKLKRFDLPKDKKISYIRMFPRNYDSTVSSILQFSGLLGSTLKSRYPKMKINPPVYSENFQKDLMRSISRDYEKGIRYFSLDLYFHGTKQGFQNHDNIGGSAIDIAKIAKAFPDAKFIINTVACHQAGLSKFTEIAKKSPQLKNRISVFMQTTPEHVNLPAQLNTPVKRLTTEQQPIYSTYYYLFFANALQQGKSYGEAALEADILSRNASYLDAETIIKGELIH